MCTLVSHYSLSFPINLGPEQIVESFLVVKISLRRSISFS